MLQFLPKISSLARRAAGFTMIELLIVITILGILAVAVLSAINPIEQINRGRDTGKTSDAEQMLNAIERFNAFQGYAPWREDGDSNVNISALTTIDSNLVDDATSACQVVHKLSTAPSGSTCVGTDEVKPSYVTRILEPGNTLFLYSRGNPGDSSYVCFSPDSKAFQQQAATRCGDAAGAGLPEDLVGIAADICTPGAELVCLP